MRFRCCAAAGTVLDFLAGLEIRRVSEQVMHTLFEALAMRFEFSLQGIPEIIKN